MVLLFLCGYGLINMDTYVDLPLARYFCDSLLNDCCALRLGPQTINDLLAQPLLVGLRLSAGSQGMASRESQIRARQLFLPFTFLTQS